MKDGWDSEDSNPIKDIRDQQEAMKDCGGVIEPLYKIDFSKITVVSDETHINKRGEPRNDVLIFEDKLVCHPDYEDRLKQGLNLFFNNKQNE